MVHIAIFTVILHTFKNSRVNGGSDHYPHLQIAELHVPYTAVYFLRVISVTEQITVHFPTFCDKIAFHTTQGKSAEYTK